MGRLKKKCLIGHFAEVWTVAQIQQMLMGIKVKSGEEIISYADRVEGLIAELIRATLTTENPSQELVTFTKNLHEKTAIQAFVSGLPSTFAIIVKASKPQNLQEAIELAFEEDRAEKFKTPLEKEVRFPPKNRRNSCLSCGHSNS